MVQRGPYFIQDAFTFDDVLILPGYSEIESRSTISLDTKFLGMDLRLPIISANMDYVTEADMAIAMLRAGGFYILHRFLSGARYQQELSVLYSEYEAARTPKSISVGTRDLAESLGKVRMAQASGKSGVIVTVDVAHGHHKKVAETTKALQYEGFDKIIAGNVATADGYMFLADLGVQAIKVGIGPGSVCTTREVTGVGVPQLSAIMDCAKAQRGYDIPIIADGGIKNSGDIVKALAAGADLVMLGSLLAGTTEAPGEAIIDAQGGRWKPYRGQSIFGVNESKYTPEGIEGYVRQRGPVADVLRHLAGGIRSGLSYVGANNLDELRAKAHFVKVSQATHIESKTRISTAEVLGR